MTAPEREPLSFRDALASLEALPDTTFVGNDPWERRPVTAGELTCRLVFGTASAAEVAALLVLRGLPIRCAGGDLS